MLVSLHRPWLRWRPIRQPPVSTVRQVRPQEPRIGGRGETSPLAWGNTLRTSGSRTWLPMVQRIAGDDVELLDLLDLLDRELQGQQGRRSDLVDNINEVGRPAGTPRPTRFAGSGRRRLNSMQRSWPAHCPRTLRWSRPVSGHAPRRSEPTIPALLSRHSASISRLSRSPKLRRLLED